jgi:hypothetical protein
MERRDPWPEAWAKWLSEARDTNPYASADTMRAWDNVVRNTVADALERVAARWRAWYTEAHQAMPAPSRDAPLPDPSHLSVLRLLKQQAEACSNLAAAVRAREMPAHDRVFHRLRNHDTLLETLLHYDAHLASLCETLNHLADPAPLAEEPTRRARLQQILALLDETLRARAEALVPPMP